MLPIFAVNPLLFAYGLTASAVFLPTDTSHQKILDLISGLSPGRAHWPLRAVGLHEPEASGPLPF